MDRAYTVLQFRAVDDAQRIIEGVASTDAVDSYGTILEPRGAKYELPMPLLWQHDQESPVGHVLDVTVENDRIRVRAQILKLTEAGPVKDTLDRAWQNVKHGLVRGLSVGFQPVKKSGKRFLEWDWRELSLVTLPSTPGATIEMVRSADQFGRAASGAAPSSRSPGVSGTSTTNPRRSMTIQEQIQQHENTRAAKIARKEELIKRSGDEGRTLDAAESEEFDTLDTEVRSIDEHLVRLNTLKRDTETRATPVNGQGSAAAAQSRGGVAVVKTQDKAAAGIGFARYVMGLVACNGNRYEAGEYVKRAFPEGDITNEVAGALQTRAAVAAGTTTNATFAAPLIVTNYLNEFLEMLRPRTIIGRLPGLRRVPFNVSLPTQTAGGTYSWVGQGALKPVTNLQLTAVTLAFAKASGIIVISEELARMSTPSAQEVVRDELLAGMTQYLDTQFIDPTVAAVANVNPASISNGVAGTAASGTTEAAARADLRALINGFNTGNLGLGGVVLLMGEGMAFTLGTIVNAVGQPAFPGLTAAGGTLYGLPVITSNILTTDIYAVHAPSIMVADEGGIEIDVSREASLIMDSAPNSVVQAGAAAPVYTSLWQANLVALRAERFITWGKARSTAVRRINTAAYV